MSPRVETADAIATEAWTLRHAIAGAALRTTASSAELGKRIAAWLPRAFTLTNPDGALAATINERVVDQAEALPAAPEDSDTQVDTPRCRVLRNGARVRLIFAQAQSALDLSAGTAVVWLARDWWQQPLKQQQDPWLLTLIWLLREHGRYSLHASAVCRDGEALLVAGASGSGKSSTALSLIHAGWDWLADDAVVLEPGSVPGSAPHLHGLARGFAFHPALAGRLAGLTGEPADDKQLVEIETLFPGRQATAARPVALLLPRVTGGASSRLEPISRLEALSELLPASGGILVGRGTAQAQLTALRELVTAVPGYRLHAAQDIFGRGEALERLLPIHRLMNNHA